MNSPMQDSDGDVNNDVNGDVNDNGDCNENGAHAYRRTNYNYNYNYVSLCGPSRSKCGYCQGSRTSVFSTPNPRVNLRKLQHSHPHSHPHSHSHPQYDPQQQQQQMSIMPPPDIGSPLVISPETNSNPSDNDADNRGHGHSHDDNMDDNTDDSADIEREQITPSTSSKAYSIVASSIEPEDYQKLLDRCWRRSGDLLYLPKNWESCCPSHPIRLDVNKFIPGKGHKKVLRNFKSALNAGIERGDSEATGTGIGTGTGTGIGTDGSKGKHKGKPLKSTLEKNQVLVQGRKRARQQNQDGSLLSSSSSSSSSSKSNNDKPTIDQVHDHTRSLIEKCGASSILQHEISAILTNYLHNLQLQRNENDDDGGNDNDNAKLGNKLHHIVQKCSCFKITKMNKPTNLHLDNSSQPQQQHQSQNHHWNYTIRIILSTTICSALHGTSRGKVDKQILSNHIVDKLRTIQRIQQFDINHSGQAQTQTLTAEDNKQSIKLESISSHAKSGHINVSLHINGSMTKREGQTTTTTTTTTHGGSGNNNNINTNNNNSNSNDKKPLENSKKRIEAAISEFILSNNGETFNQNNHQGLQPPYVLTVKSIPSCISGRDPKVHRLYTKYQAAIHDDTDPFLPSREEDTKMMETWNSDVKEEEKFDYMDDTTNSNSSCSVVGGPSSSTGKLSERDFGRIYRGYNETQRQKIYKSYTDYYRFLCSSPIPNGNNKNMESTSPNETNGTKQGDNEKVSFMFDIEDGDTQIPYGSYHQQYLINDKYLIAVGVIDVLPKCISSVYAFYDPVISRNINLGKLTALYEIDWVKHAQQFRTNLKYYYLGYYIHSCQKMRYKAEYKPSDILCPVRKNWVAFEVAKKRLESRSPIRHCCDLSTPSYDEKDSIDEFNSNLPTKGTSFEEGDNLDLDCIRLSLAPNSRPITINMLTNEGQDIIRPILKEFVLETGIEVAQRCVIKLF